MDGVATESGAEDLEQVGPTDTVSLAVRGPRVDEAFLGACQAHGLEGLRAHPDGVCIILWLELHLLALHRALLDGVRDLVREQVVAFRRARREASRVEIDILAV